MDILKMSNFQTLEENVCKKCILLGHRVKFQKNHFKIVSINFYYFLKKQFKNKNSLPIIYNLGNE